MASVIDEGKYVYHWKNDTDGRIPKCSNRPVPLRLSHKSQTEWPGFGLRSPGWEATDQSPGTLHCQRVFYVPNSHENKTVGNAKWHFRSAYRKEQRRMSVRCPQHSWRHIFTKCWTSVGIAQAIHGILFVLICKIFFYLSFMWFTFVSLSTL